MFASLLQSKNTTPSETTPLLAALKRFRNHQNDVDGVPDDDEAAVIAQYGRGEEDEEEREDEDRHRDGPLLPVFSSTFLGMSCHVYDVFCLHH
jgi:hypothetical protein